MGVKSGYTGGFERSAVTGVVIHLGVHFGFWTPLFSFFVLFVIVFSFRIWVFLFFDSFMFRILDLFFCLLILKNGSDFLDLLFVVFGFRFLLEALERIAKMVYP